MEDLNIKSTEEDGYVGFTWGVYDLEDFHERNNIDYVLVVKCTLESIENYEDSFINQLELVDGLVSELENELWDSYKAELIKSEKPIVEIYEADNQERKDILLKCKEYLDVFYSNWDDRVDDYETIPKFEVEYVFNIMKNTINKIQDEVLYILDLAEEKIPERKSLVIYYKLLANQIFKNSNKLIEQIKKLLLIAENIEEGEF